MVPAGCSRLYAGDAVARTARKAPPSQAGGRGYVVLMDELAERIAARLHEALDRQVAGDFYAEERRGLVNVEPGGLDMIGAVRLSVEDVARIAADEARR